MLILKEYQANAKNAMDRYFQVLEEEQEKVKKIPKEVLQEWQNEINFAEKTWHTLFPESDKNHDYKSKRTGHGKPCPNFCLKIPTGGGKTLLATYAIEHYLEYIKQSKTGFVLWVVPSEQIYSQTLSALKDRAHPYREKLDAISDNRVKIITKQERFSPNDIEENLVILVMMLQSFSRDKIKKDDLKFFQDNGKFDEFFPLESDQVKQSALLKEFTNLDKESSEDSLFGVKIKTSFGNVVKILEPLIILDEGHKAKSELALSAITECNPSCVCELTATPTDQANVLFSVAGRELEKEEMIKLDLNLIEKDTVEWKNLVNYSIDHLNQLQEQAEKHKNKTGIYIRPINLIQVEATGKDQRKEGNIHADDVKEHLIATGLVKEDEIAMKTSSKNDIEGQDLLSPQCAIRFIITKQALQEGWDCPFAYSLTVLGGSKSKTALTQLVGRVLRQPYARKTKIKELDESYVFCLRDSSKDLVKAIRTGFEYDGMGDLAQRISSLSGKTDPELGERKKQTLRKHFAKSLEDFALPTFVVKDNRSKDGTRILDPALDIFPEIDYEQINLDKLKGIHINPENESIEKNVAIGFTREFAEDTEEYLEIQEKRLRSIIHTQLKKSFWVRNILEHVPNPWVAEEVVSNALKILKSQFSDEEIERNQIFLLDELIKILGGTGQNEGEINRLAKELFMKKLANDSIRFVPKFGLAVLQPDEFFEKEVRKRLTVDKSLFEPVIGEDLNNLEEKALWRMEESGKTFWWYRNKAKKDFYLIAWKRNRFYPDFILTIGKDKDTFEKIYLVETKGGHLLGNTDTNYKQNLTKLYQRPIQNSWTDNQMFKKEPKPAECSFVEEANLDNAMNEILA
ncbi:MAG: DEAD/DEAH box helicase family protein [Candidatus Peregrinibacteria bacterium]|nr:DEAD/DEAH box helicase family protein [Candidatus Peregrinibacteria bacterium]